MGKGRETYGKKDVRSKKEKKRKEKELKRIERRENKGTGNPEDMFAYVDEFGNITSTPPDPSQRATVRAEDIQIAVPRNLSSGTENTIHNGVVKFFDEGKGYGFIKDLENRQDIFVHSSGLMEPVTEGNKVLFEVMKGMNGWNAVNVKIDREP